MEQMVCFGASERLARLLPPEIQGGGAGFWTLCAISGDGVGQTLDRPLRCKTLLTPGGVFSSRWQAEQVVSYGLDRRCTLTLSSLEKPVLCVQRRLDTPLGTLEEQELPLCGRWEGFSAATQLFLAGVWLLGRGYLPVVSQGSAP